MPTGWGHNSFETAKNRYLLAQRSAPTGDTYVLLYAMQETNYPTFVFQKTVELKPMRGAQVSVLDAATLQRGLDVDGKVVVYGVFFDTGKADVKPESKPSLDEMAKLLAKNRHGRSTSSATPTTPARLPATSICRRGAPTRW